MSDEPASRNMNRREMLGTVGKAAAATVVLPPFVHDAAGRQSVLAPQAQLAAVAGPDRIVVMPGKTYINGWAGHGEPPRRIRRRRGQPEEAPPETGPPPAVTWSKESGPGDVEFADAQSLVTTAAFSAPGAYVLKLVAREGEAETTSTFHVTVETAPPATPLDPIQTKGYRIDSRLWNQRLKTLIVNWIPHCIDQLNAPETAENSGGIGNFVEAARALAGEPHGEHKGYVFSNAYVHQTVESMCLALMYDARGDEEILAAQARMRETLEDWIPKILAARESDGYLQTAFTLRDPERWAERWSPEGRRNHEGYVAGYFIESAIAHYLMTQGRDTRLYDAARKLADCWYDNIGPPPKKEWYDGHQEMEQGLVRFGRFVNEVEGAGTGERYIQLAKFLLDCRGGGFEYDQSHLPVVQQYEAVGHAVRASYNYSAMTDIALETGDVDYQSAIRSIWDNIVNRKYYLTGGLGSGETSEGFGPDYSLRNNSYCESCASCGEIFFQAKMNRLYHEARYADLFEETIYNGVLGSTDHEGLNYYYTNPLDARAPRHPWHSVPCCVGNIPKTLLMLPTWMYARSADDLYVNLFVGSTVRVEDIAGTHVEMVQTTEYPWDGGVTITVNPAETRTFGIRIRVPDRSVSNLYRSSPEANGILSIAVNGSPVEPRVENGYAIINRAWNAGDTIDLVLPLQVQRVRADERIAANRGRVALRYGPLVYNIEQADQDITQTLDPRAALATEWDEDLLGGLVVIKGRFSNGAELTAIPNYARMNRLPPAEPRPQRTEAGERPPPPPVTSIVWIEEA